jgi:hypothetical protein
MGNETFAGLFVYPQTSKEPGSCIPGGG